MSIQAIKSQDRFARQLGTEADPQGWSRQADALAAAGAAVFASNSAATRYALALLGASS